MRIDDKGFEQRSGGAGFAAAPPTAVLLQGTVRLQIGSAERAQGDVRTARRCNQGAVLPISRARPGGPVRAPPEGCDRSGIRPSAARGALF